MSACAPPSASPPPAQTSAEANGQAEATYLALHKAIAAFERCRDPAFDDRQRAALETRAQRLAGEPLGAGTMLGLIERAKAEVSRRISTAGCQDGEVAGHVARFERDLAGAAGL